MKLFPNEIAASSAVPNLPTIALSTNWTNECPISPTITGYESFKLYENSFKYELKIKLI